MTETTSHRSRVLNVLGSNNKIEHVAVCSCGWVSGNNTTKLQAQVLSNGHLVNALRAAEKADKT